MYCFSFLEKIIKFCSLDPFGASSVTPTLWAEAGFEYFVIDRIDYRIKVFF